MNSRYLQLSVYTFMALNVNGETGLLLEPVMSRALGDAQGEGHGQAQSEEPTREVGRELESERVDEVMDSIALPGNVVVETEAPVTAQITPKNPLLSEEEEEFFKEL
jgi:hypothetical protein